MVSHHAPPQYSELPPPQQAPSAPSLGHNRAASVTSGRSATRRHRHARNHHGGSGAYAPQNEFPVFSHTGDVEILLSTVDGRKEKRYMLHRLILSQCSGFFEAGTRAEWSRGGAEDGRGLATIAESSMAGSSSRASSTERRPSIESGMPRRRWRYVLDWQASSGDEAPMLVQKESNGPPSIFGGGSSEDRAPPIRSKPPASHDGFFRSMTNFSALSLNSHPNTTSGHLDTLDEPGDEILKDYDNLFRTIYQYPPVLDTLSIATAYTECKALLHLADMYDCLEIVGSRVDHHMLRFGARLFKQIAKYPPSYLKLGYLARSRTIFSEALVHVVGQWPLAAPQLRGTLDRDALELLEDKAEDLEDLKARVEAKLWRLTLTTSRGERVSPSNDYLAWLAMSLFRQWFAENTTPLPSSILRTETRPGTGGGGSQVSASNGASRRTASRASSNHVASQRVPAAQQAPAPQAQHPPPLNTAKVFKLLGSANSEAYLVRDELKRFLKLQPELYTKDNLKRLERRVDDLKHLARDAVRPLMRNFLELDLSAFGPGGLPYLTCTRVDDTDLPWDG